RVTSPLLVVTPVAPAEQASAAMEPTVKLMLSRKWTKLPAPVVAAANVLTVLGASGGPTTHKSMLPPPSTLSAAAVIVPAAIWDTEVAAFSRTVAVPAAMALLRVMEPAVVRRVTSPLLVVTPVAPAEQASAATEP